MPKLLIWIVLCCFPLAATADTFTQPIPNGEPFVTDIVLAICPTCARISDEAASDFSFLSGVFFIGFEDTHTGLVVGKEPDYDFNDYIAQVILNNGAFQSGAFLGSYSAASQSFFYTGSAFCTNATGLPYVALSCTDPALNFDGKQHGIVWTVLDDPTPEVPEPETFLLFASAMFVLAWRRRNG